MTWGLTYRGIHSSLKGLRISRIEGRDTLPEIESRTAQAGTKHGSYYFGHRLNEKIITVEINLFEASLANFRSAIRDLASWLDPRNGPQELIFDDEPDKKYYAVVTGNTDFEGIFAKRVAEIEFLCPDPFAYALSETVASFSENLLTIDNDGTAEAFPVIEITADGTAGPDNFEGKIAGSTKENPHIGKTAGLSFVGIPTPSEASFEITDSNYSRIMYLDGSTLPATRTNYGSQGNLVFSFNLIALIKRKFGFTVPGANLGEQVQWLKDNISNITANWWGKGTNKQANPTGIANFAGKVAGSTVENPHKAYRTSSTPAAGLMTPTTGEVEFASDDISYLDGKTVSAGTLTSTRQSQHLFSFNLIEYVQRKYGVTIPGSTTADKVQWLKDNLVRLGFRWHGFGNGPAGNNATNVLWYNDSWQFPASHSSGSVNVLARNTTSFASFVQSDGFIHYLVYADASDGTTASTINTDYVELEVELKPGEDKASIARWSSILSSWNVQSEVNQTNGIQKLTTGGSSNHGTYIDSNGFYHLLAYSEPSNGISPSAIETDYIELQVTLSGIGGIKVSNGDEFIAITRTFTSGDEITIDHQKGTITLNGVTNIITSLDIESDFFPLRPGQNDLTVGGGSGAVTYTKRWL